MLKSGLWINQIRQYWHCGPRYLVFSNNEAKRFYYFLFWQHLYNRTAATRTLLIRTPCYIAIIWTKSNSPWIWPYFTVIYYQVIRTPRWLEFTPISLELCYFNHGTIGKLEPAQKSLRGLISDTCVDRRRQWRAKSVLVQSLVLIYRISCYWHVTWSSSTTPLTRTVSRFPTEFQLPGFCCRFKRKICSIMIPRLCKNK